MTPEGWREVRLDQVVEVVGGGTPARENAAYWEGDIPWATPSDVTRLSGRQIRATASRISEEGLSASAATLLPAGSVLMTSRATIGACAINAVPMATNQGFQNLVPSAATTAEFLSYLVRYRTPDLIKMAAGSTFLEISRRSVAALLLALPPLGEQQKIAAILSSVDDAIEATQAVIDQLQLVKKAMMAELLTRGVPGRHTRFKATEIGVVPEDWDVVRAGDLCSVVTKGSTPASQTRDTGDVPFFKVYNIDPGGFVDFTYQPTFIPRHVHDTELKRSRVRPGDVLMNIVGPPLGKVATVPHDFPEANINQAIAVFRPERVEPEFLNACLSSEHLFGWALSRAKRTSTQLNLTLELCRDYPMPLPPRDERSHILRAVQATIDRLNAEVVLVEQLSIAKSALMSVLLTGEVRVRPDPEVCP